MPPLPPEPRERREVARKGGLAVSRNRQHISEIGPKGGPEIPREPKPREQGRR